MVPGSSCTVFRHKVRVNPTPPKTNKSHAVLTPHLTELHAIGTLLRSVVRVVSFVVTSVNAKQIDCVLF